MDIFLSLLFYSQSSFSEFVPLIVEMCTSIVEARGLEVVGIYRVPGNTAAIAQLTESVNKGFENINLQVLLYFLLCVNSFDFFFHIQPELFALLCNREFAEDKFVEKFFHSYSKKYTIFKSL